MSWDEEAATWDDDPAVRTYSGAAFRSLVDTCASRGLDLDGARVLDFGCGTGLLSEAVAPHAREVVCLDASEAMVEVLRHKIEVRGLTGMHALHGELPALLASHPTLAAPFDLVVCSSVCAFLDDYPATALLLAGCLAPGGLLVQWDWALDPEAEEPFGLSREGIRAALEGAGLVDVSVDIGFEEPYEDEVMAPLRGVGRRRPLAWPG